MSRKRQTIGRKKMSRLQWKRRVARAQKKTTLVLLFAFGRLVCCQLEFQHVLQRVQKVVGRFGSVVRGFANMSRAILVKLECRDSVALHFSPDAALLSRRNRMTDQR